MSLPGFTAESAIDRQRSSYVSFNSSDPTLLHKASRIVPAQCYQMGCYLYYSDCERTAQGWRRYGYNAGCGLGCSPGLPWALYVCA